MAEHDLQLAPAEHAALGVDLFLGQLHAVAVCSKAGNVAHTARKGHKLAKNAKLQGLPEELVGSTRVTPEIMCARNGSHMTKE